MSFAWGETYNLTTFDGPDTGFPHWAASTTRLFNMKFQPDVLGVQSISGYGDGWIGVGQEKISVSFVMSSRGERFNWNCEAFEDLTPAHFLQLAELQTELVIFGSGQKIRFPKPAWIRPLIERQTGIETMDVQAACRTYNILAGEGRHVALALLLEREPTQSP